MKPSRPHPGLTPVSWLSSVGLASIVLIACGGSSAATLDPAVTLPGFRAGPATVLTLDDVASDAVDHAQLVRLLSDQGFTSASLRAYSAGLGGPVRTVRVEVVSFEGAGGAQAYLDWLREHAADVVGEVREEPRLAPPADFVFSHAPSACCSKEQAVWLAGWREGSSAVWIEVMGPDVRPARVGALVARLGTSA